MLGTPFISEFSDITFVAYNLYFISQLGSQRKYDGDLLDLDRGKDYECMSRRVDLG
jgi:hypothetical protein